MKIKHERLYSLGEIVREEIIPGIDTIPKASRLVNHPVFGKILSPSVEKRGARGMQYKVLGSNIRKYLQHEKATNNT